MIVKLLGGPMNGQEVAVEGAGAVFWVERMAPVEPFATLLPFEPLRTERGYYARPLVTRAKAAEIQERGWVELSWQGWT